MNRKPSKRVEAGVNNLQKAFQALERSATTPITEPRDLSGVVKDFELLYELSWKTLKKFLESQGHEVHTAKHALETAYQLKLLSNEKVWLQMIDDRNKTVHTYNEKFAREMCERIQTLYLKAFRELLDAVSA
jgi:nucleotidyltransferase substrate binding protein (TIGR01987 family)